MPIFYFVTGAVWLVSELFDEELDVHFFLSGIFL